MVMYLNEPMFTCLHSRLRFNVWLSRDINICSKLNQTTLFVLIQNVIYFGVNLTPSSDLFLKADLSTISSASPVKKGRVVPVIN
jgi:hypothetical protein